MAADEALPREMVHLIFDWAEHDYAKTVLPIEMPDAEISARVREHLALLTSVTRWLRRPPRVLAPVLHYLYHLAFLRVGDHANQHIDTRCMCVVDEPWRLDRANKTPSPSYLPLVTLVHIWNDPPPPPLRPRRPRKHTTYDDLAGLLNELADLFQAMFPRACTRMFYDDALSAITLGCQATWKQSDGVFTLLSSPAKIFFARNRLDW